MTLFIEKKNYKKIEDAFEKNNLTFKLQEKRRQYLIRKQKKNISLNNGK